MPILSSPLKGSLERFPNGILRQGFGENPELYAPLGLKAHNGLDLATFKGDSVCASQSGIIFNLASVGDSTKESLTKYNGNVVWLLTDICKDGLVYLCVYGHLDSISVKAGDKVFIGKEIGKEGNTGTVMTEQNNVFWGNAPANAGTHCHFGVYRLVEGDDGYQSFKVGGKLWHIEDLNNGYKGAVDPLPLITDFSEVSLLQTIVNLLRSIITKLGAKPIV